MRQDATDWAVAEFGGAPGLEKRLRGRLVQTAAALAALPAPCRSGSGGPS